MKYIKFRSFILPLGLLVIIALYLLCYRLLNTSGYLSFSDGAKYADVARNLLQFGVYGSSFKFFSGLNPQTLKTFPFEAGGILPGMPIVLYIFFLLFGASDFSATLSSAFILLLCLVFLFLLGKRYYGTFAAALTVLMVGVNINLIEYSLNGASEMLIVLEMLLAVYLITLRAKIARICAGGVLILMYFTRFNAVVYIAPIIFFWLVSEFGLKRGTIKFVITALLGLVIDKFILGWLEGKYFFYQVFSGGLSGIVSISSGQSPSEYLREPIHGLASLKDIGIKTFYNIYNFYKFIPQIFSPYLFTLFLLGILLPSKKIEENYFKIFTALTLVFSLIAYAFTIPFFRYLHPTIPFIYLVAVGTLIKIVGKIGRGVLISVVIVSFILINSLGTILLDSRYLVDRVNKGQLPVYVRLSWLLRDITEPDDIIVTNLDTWGSWYGERKTVWFPLEPNQLSDFVDDVDAIYLTSYLMDDENYYMGEAWRKVFNSPEMHDNDFLNENYELKGVYEIGAEDTYEREAARAILLVSKKNE